MSSSLFIEKYRPRLREEIVGNKAEIDRIFSIVKCENIPHMIFEGSQPGTGKTTTALVIARTLFGEYYKQNWLELNASDDRGIGVVQDEIKTFCKTAPLGATFKILFLDEADGLTRQAQDALRRIMEQYSSVTRFILCCNDYDKLIEPIQSRCERFHFSPLSVENIAFRVRQVAERENINIDEEAIIYLAEKSEGDMRKALNKLQVLSSYGCSIDKKLLSRNEVSFSYSSQILDSLQKGRFLEARTYTKDGLLLGLSERNILEDLHQMFINHPTIPPLIKGDCIEILAESDYKLTLGVSKSLQIDSVLLKLLKLLKNS